LIQTGNWLIYVLHIKPMSFLRQQIYEYKLLVTSVLSVHHNIYRTFLTNMYKTQLIPQKRYYLQMKGLRFWLWNFKSAM